MSVAPASPNAEPETEDNASTFASAAPTPNRINHGDIIKAIGENGEWKDIDGGPDDPNVINFKVTSITPAVFDNPYAQEPSGIPMAVTLEIETIPDFERPTSVNGAPGQISFSLHY